MNPITSPGNPKNPFNYGKTIKISERKEITLDTIKIPMYNHNGSKKALIIVGRDITDILKNLEEKKDIEKKPLKPKNLKASVSSPEYRSRL
jgi:hypothetical protein